MNTSDSIDWPKSTFFFRGKERIKTIFLLLYTHIFSYKLILEKLRKRTRKSQLNAEQEKRLQHFITFIDAPQNIDILEYLCEMKTSKKHDIVSLLECFEKAEQEQKIGPQFVMDTILLFYHAPRQSLLSIWEKKACNRLRSILVSRLPKIEKILPKKTKV